MRILALDDMDERQSAFARWFADQELLQARDARTAIGALEMTGRFDLALLDHDLSDEHYRAAAERLPYGKGTGMEVARYIAAMPEARRPRLVVVHSWNRTEAQKMVEVLEVAGVATFYRMFDPRVCPVRLGG